jgi:hypothetical protein
MKNYHIYNGQNLSIDGVIINPQTAVKILQLSESGLSAIVETVYSNQGIRFQCSTENLISMEVTETTDEVLDKTQITNVTVEGIDYSDYPDFCDAYITNADYNGVKMTKEQLHTLNKDSGFINESVFSQLF